MGMTFGFMVNNMLEIPIFYSAALSCCHKVVLPLPLGPPMNHSICWGELLPQLYSFTDLNAVK